MESVLIIVLAVLALLFFIFVISKNKNNYEQISHLPFATPPTGDNCNSLGYSNLIILQDSYPPTTIKYSCNDKCGIYETSNSRNPNVYSEFGYIKPNNITF